MLVLTRNTDGGRSGTCNMRAAVLEVANDALGSVAVLVAALVIATTGWLRADAVVPIGMLILPRTLRLLRETADVLLEATPRGLDVARVREHLLTLDHVQPSTTCTPPEIATGLPVLTAQVVPDDSCFFDGHAPGYSACTPEPQTTMLRTKEHRQEHAGSVIRFTCPDTGPRPSRLGWS